jgi:tetratricopeptide (TPR) repeat protein
MIGGLVAYSVQNFFWFDTPAASVTFYIYLGFATCLSIKKEQQPLKQKSSVRLGLPGALVLIGIAAGSGYCVFVTDFVTAAVLRDINHATTERNAYVAKTYFDKAAKRSFIFDPGELRSRYVDFIGQLLQQQKGQVDVGLIKKTIDDAIAVSHQVTQQGIAETRVWVGLAYLYLERSRLNGASPDPQAYTSIQNAIASAPNEIEPLLMLAHYYTLVNRPDQALATLQYTVGTVPKYALAHWRLALLYRDLHQDELASQAANEALEFGYRFQPAELAWLINHYADKGNYAKVAELYERAIRVSPADYQLHANLAATYAKLGERQKAIAAAQKALQLNPSLEPYFKRFVALHAAGTASSAP